MNTEKFTGKAQAYAKARPGYPDETIEYIRKLVSPDAVFADIGAGTGKFTELLARYGKFSRLSQTLICANNLPPHCRPSRTPKS